MEELVVNGRYYPMWSGIIDKKSQFKRVVNIDMGMVAKADLVDIRLESNGEDSTKVVFEVNYKGKPDEWSVDVKYAGISGNKTGIPGLCISSMYSGDFIIQNEKEAAGESEPGREDPQATPETR